MTAAGATSVVLAAGTNTIDAVTLDTDTSVTGTAGTFTINDGRTLTINGTLSAEIGGLGDINVTGDSTLGTNTPSGINLPDVGSDLFVNGHTLTLNDSDRANIGDVDLGSGGTINVPNGIALAFQLRGTGTINGPLQNDGLVDPNRESIGTIATGDYSTSATTNIDIDSDSVSNSDRINVSGAVSLGGTLHIFDAGSGTASNKVYTIITNDGMDGTGTFSMFGSPANLQVANEGAIANVNGTDYMLSYVGGDGNDVTLTEFTPVDISVDAGGNLVIDADGPFDHSMSLSFDGTNYTITSSLPISSSVGSPSSGTTITIPDSALTGSLNFALGDGDDTLTIDLGGGNFPRPIRFDGGEGDENVGDELVLTGGGLFDDVTHRFTNVAGGDADNGTIDISGNQTITYTGLEPVTDNLDVADRIFNFVGGAETITLDDSGTLANRIDSGLGESVDFNNPSSSLTINTELDGGSGADNINVQGLDGGFAANLNINAGSDDTVTFQTAATNSGTGNISVDANSIIVNAPIAAGNGNISLTADSIDISANISSTGTLLLAPRTAATTVGVGTTATGTFHLNNSDIANLVNGFSLINIGTTASGAMDVDSGTFSDSVTLRGSSITVTGLDVGANNATLIAVSGSINDGGDAGTDIIGNGVTLNAEQGDIGAFADAVSLNAGAIVTDTTDGGTNGSQFLSEADTVNVLGLNAGDAGLIQLDGGEFDLNGTEVINDESRVNLNSPAVLDLNNLDETIAGLSGTGNVTLGTGNLIVDQTNDTSYFPFFSGQISGDGDVTKEGIGRWTLRNANTYVGVTRVNQGDLWFENANSLGAVGPTSNTIVAAGAELYVDGSFTVNEHLSLMGALEVGGVLSRIVDWAGPVVLTGNTEIAPVAPLDVLTISGQMSGSGGFTKEGDGDLFITGDNTYSGDTLVDSAAMFVNNTSGSATGTGTVTLASGTALGGTGSISGLLNANSMSTVAPGLIPGVLQLAGGVDFKNDSDFEVEINGVLPGNGAGNHDQLDVVGTVTIGTGVALNLSGTHIPMLGQEFVIIENDGSDAINGTFDGMPEGHKIVGFLGSGLDASISYQGGDGNDVVISLGAFYDFEMASYAVDELNVTHTTTAVTVLRSGALISSSSVDVLLTGNTAGGSDFVAGSIPVTFAIGETSQTVPIEILGENIVELDETIDLSFANFVGGAPGTNNATSVLTITNDDAATISIDDVSVVESGNFEFTVTMSNPVDIAIALQADTTNGSAKNGLDITPLTAVLMAFPEGNQTQNIDVQSLADFISEVDETFFVDLSNISAGGRDVTFADSQGLGTIIDIPLLAIDDVAIPEGDSGTTTALVPARLSEALTADLLVEYTVDPGTALATEDYLTTSGNFTIPAGETMFEFPISVVGDQDPETDETFTVVVGFLDSPGNTVAGSDSRAVVTIENDDQLAVVGVKVGSTEWEPDFKAFIDPTGDAFGYPIPTGANQLAPLPWANINQIQMRFNAHLGGSFAENLFGLGGFHTPDYASQILSTIYDSTEFTVTITLDTFLGDDQLVLVASELLTHSSGDMLDGEWTTGQASSRSGDGVAGGNFEFRFDVLPGDVDQSGMIGSNDGFTALRLQSTGVGASNYLAFADIDGSGSISSNDGFFALARQSTDRPKGTPTVPTLPRAAQVDLAIALLAEPEYDEQQHTVRIEIPKLVDDVFDRFSTSIH